MPGIIFDTSIWIARKPARMPASLLMSAVVVQEMTAGATDQTSLKRWSDTRRTFEQEGKLLVPDGEDWYQAGRILNHLLRGLKSRSQGLTPKLHPDDKQRIIRDVLIARTAQRSGAAVVTDNVKDFERIRRFCKVKVISGDQYFGQG